MKKIVAFTLMLCMVFSLVACGKGQITMQEIYDAGQNETLLKNHQSVHIRDEMNDEVLSERYLTKEFIYEHFSDEEFDWAEFLTNDAYYDYFDGAYARVLPISPDGVRDIASFRAEYYASLLFAPDTVYETIESVSKKDGHITVVSFFNQEALENTVDDGLTSGHYEYVLDAKNHEVISCSGDYTYDDGTTHHITSKVTYDAEAPEMTKVFLEYANQTEDLRNITIISHPGTEKEVSQNFQSPKGLLVVFCSASNFEPTFELYTDAACTELYDVYADTNSDLTIYVKWIE